MSADKERIGGVPIDIRQEGSNLAIRFYPKSHDAKYPDQHELVIKLDDKER